MQCQCRMFTSDDGQWTMDDVQTNRQWPTQKIYRPWRDHFKIKHQCKKDIFYPEYIKNAPHCIPRWHWILHIDSACCRTSVVMQMAWWIHDNWWPSVQSGYTRWHSSTLEDLRDGALIQPETSFAVLLGISHYKAGDGVEVYSLVRADQKWAHGHFTGELIFIEVLLKAT